MMQLIRCLFFILAQFEISLRATHFPGHLNTGADAISRNNLYLFHTRVPQISLIATPCNSTGTDGLAGPSSLAMGEAFAWNNEELPSSRSF